MLNNRLDDPIVVKFLNTINRYEAWQEISLNPKLTVEELTRLSAHSNETVREAVVDNKNVTSEILENMFYDHYDDAWFIAKFISNKKTPEKLLLEASRHPHVSLRREVAALLRTPEEALMVLVQDEDEMTASDAVNTLCHKHAPYNTWPEEWVYAHFNVTKHIPDDTW